MRASDANANANEINTTQETNNQSPVATVGARMESSIIVGKHAVICQVSGRPQVSLQKRCNSWLHILQEARVDNACARSTPTCSVSLVGGYFLKQTETSYSPCSSRKALLACLVCDKPQVWSK